MSLSAVIIARNEQANIVSCLSSLQFADEIVVVDSGSSDHTIDLAKKFTDKVYQRDFDDFSSQKNFAVSFATCDWILSIDADERVTSELAGEIQRIMSGGGPYAAYAIKRKTVLFGRIFRFSGLQDDKPIRLFKKGAGRFDQPVHERVEVNGRVGLLKNSLEHRSFQTIGEYLRKLQHYTALDRTRVGSTKTVVHFFLKPMHRFLSLYFFKQGLRDGVEGFIYCAFSAYYEFIRQAKQWETQVSIKKW